MALYRVRTRLSFGQRIVPAGQLLPGSRFKAEALAALLRRGAVSEVSAPPLAILPGWETRAKQVASIGIMSASDFIEADIGILTDALDANLDLILKWQKEAKGWLQTESMIN